MASHGLLSWSSSDLLFVWTVVWYSLSNYLNFFQNFSINLINMTDSEMEFDMIGADASIANAFRRILLSEVCLVKCMCI